MATYNDDPNSVTSPLNTACASTSKLNDRPSRIHLFNVLILFPPRRRSLILLCGYFKIMGECKNLVDKCSHLQNWSKFKIPMNQMPMVKSEFFNLSSVLCLLITYKYSSHYNLTIIKKTPTKTPMKGPFYGHSA